MANANIVIQGASDNVKYQSDGTVDMLFKIPMSAQVPRGLKSLGESYYLVHVSKNDWEKIKSRYKPSSNLLITGEMKANKTKSGTPIIEVVCFDISFLDDKKTKKVAGQKAADAVQQSGKKQIERAQEESAAAKVSKVRTAPEGPGQKQEYTQIKWYEPDEVILIDPNDVLLVEDIHRGIQSLNVKGMLFAVWESREISAPIAVRPLESGKYALIMGVKAFAVAKLLNLEKIKAVIRNSSHEELTKSLGIVTFET